MWLTCLSRAHLGLRFTAELQQCSMGSAAAIIKREESSGLARRLTDSGRTSVCHVSGRLWRGD